jgi:hypothetical protein
VTRFRLNLLSAGLGGLLVGGLLASISVWLISSGTVRPPLSHPAVTLITVLIFGAFSLAEIPMMIFAMRRLILERPGNYRIVMGLNALYVFFAVVYSMPVFLIAGSMLWGLILCSLGLVRFATSIVFVSEPEI